eukprot:m.119936 g.119936  ORF g.119936 m.119936 type:complete len:178 (-) comp28775_c0_seq1:242-775(-)
MFRFSQTLLRWPRRRFGPLFFAVLMCTACVDAELNPSMSPTSSPTDFDHEADRWSTMIRYAVPIIMLTLGAYFVGKYFYERDTIARRRRDRDQALARLRAPGENEQSNVVERDHHDVPLPPSHIEMSSPHVPPVYTSIATDTEPHASTFGDTFGDDMLPPSYESLERGVSGNTESEI